MNRVHGPNKLIHWLDRHIKTVFLLASVVFVLVMVVFPLVYNLLLSFTEWSMSQVDPPRFVGVRNYVNLVLEPRFLNAVFRTLVYSFGSLCAQVFFGVALALYLNREFYGKSIIKTFLLLPMVMTPVAVGMIWLLIYEPTIGLANYLLELVHLPKLLWLGSQHTALVSLMLVDVWEWTPFITIITLAGLSALPEEVFESAKVDGATSWQTLYSITIPMVFPTVIIAALLRLIDVLKTFDILYSTTQGGPGFATENINILGYLKAFQYFEFGSSAATLVVFFLMVLGATILMLFLKKYFVVEQ
ncbi:MAG: sugar ABC transporter permease [Candidatus Brocadiia bacterium]|nr:MAG: sugar ABC transporter permease [Candidatus Brocadiia bacterium]